MLSTLLLPSGLSPAPPFALGVYDSTWYPETPAGPGGPACPAGPRSPLLVWDYRGFGRSAPVTHPYTMADVAADAAGLLAATGWESCRVAGVSFGGMVAQEFAVTHPQRVERLALACTSAGGGGGPPTRCKSCWSSRPGNGWRRS